MRAERGWESTFIICVMRVNMYTEKIVRFVIDSDVAFCMFC